MDRAEMIEEVAGFDEYADAYRRPFAWYVRQATARFAGWNDSAVAMYLDNRRES